MKIWLLSFRPKTLSASLIPVMVGTALVKALNQNLVWWVSVLALAGALCIQIATNLFNDAIDFKKGADNENRMGPQRVTQSGLISEKSVYKMALFFILLAFLCGIPLVIRAGWPIAGLGAVSLFLAYSYTGGPFPLAYLGLGDLFVILFFGLFAVGGVYFINTVQLHEPAIIAGLQIGFLSTVLIAINNLRDVEQDKLVNKKTLAVRFGVLFSRIEISLLILSVFIMNIYWYYKGLVWAAILPLIILPLAIKLLLSVLNTEPSPKMNGFLAQASLIQVLFGTLLSIGLVL